MNLIAYLSDTSRPLVLRDIVETVPGYPESYDAARRAFERDKEDLRAMNFGLQVMETPTGETGYQIVKDSTYFDNALSPYQRSIVQYALSIYSPDKNLAANAVTKLGGANPENEISEITSLGLPDTFEELYQRCLAKKPISILFKDQWRVILPKKLIARAGYWYCESFDEDKQEPRTFRIDRIEEIKDASTSFTSGEAISPEIEIDESINVVLKVHPKLITQVSELYNGEIGNDNETVKFSIPRKELLLNKLYDYAGFVSVLEPKELRDEIINSQSELIEILGEVK